jgi:hypothetical protein
MSKKIASNDKGLLPPHRRVKLWRTSNLVNVAGGRLNPAKPRDCIASNRAMAAPDVCASLLD